MARDHARHADRGENDRHHDHAGDHHPAHERHPDNRHEPHEAPTEPGYPAHPEKTHRPGHPPGLERPSGRGAAHAAHAHDAHAGHDKHAGHSVEMFRDRFWLSLALTIPTLIWSHELQAWFGYTAPVFPGSQYIPPVFGTAVYVYGGHVFLQGALQELRHRLPGMMTLIALAITVAFVFSLAVTLGYRGIALWWELSTLVTIMLLGHWIEMRSIFQAQGALQELARLLPNTAVRLAGDRTEEIPIGELGEGDLVLVRPGASVPADGVIRSGESNVNEAMITGESRPVRKRPGERSSPGRSMAKDRCASK
jgi:P-type Cu2+ transporter